MADTTKLKLVRCPKCENLLSEPEDSPFFKCGGCFTVLRSQVKEREEDSVSDKSMEDKTKPVSVNSSKTSSDSDVPSTSASLRHQETVPVAVESDPCSKTKPFESDKDDPKSQSGRQESGLDRFKKRTARLSTSKYPCNEGTSSSTNYFPDQSNEAIEQDRAGLLRQLDKLKEQLTQSKEQAPSSSSSSGLNKTPPMRFFSSGPYYHPEPQFPYSNKFQMHRRGPHPYFSGQYLGNNNNGHDLFDRNFHQSSCSCYHCYDNKYWRGPTPDAPYNAGFYPHEGFMGFAPPHYGSRGLQPHGKWSSNFSDAQMDVIRPPKVVLSGRSRHVRPLAGGAPFITCRNCFELLQLPKKQQKLQCGACSCLIDLSVVNNRFVISTNTASTRQGEADYTSDDFGRLGYVFHSFDDEPTAPGLISDKSQDSLSEEELSSVSLTAKPLGLDQDSINQDMSEASSGSSRSDKDKTILRKTTAVRQNSMKEVSVEVSFNDYSEVSKDHQQRSKKNGFASIVKKSFKDLTKSIHNEEGNKSNVMINGHVLTERLLRKAEKQAGAIQPGNYW